MRSSVDNIAFRCIEFLVGVFTRAELELCNTVLIGVALCSSVAMVLPISTPPNALAHATGLIEQKSMMKVGLILGFISMAIGYVLLIFLGSNGLI